MKTIINVEEVKKKIDYQSLAQEIITLSQNGNFKRSNPVAELLNPIKDALFAARQNNASIPSLAKFFEQRGIPISEASLRRYFREHVSGARSRPGARSRARRTSNADATKHSNSLPGNSRSSSTGSA